MAAMNTIVRQIVTVIIKAVFLIYYTFHTPRRTSSGKCTMGLEN
jgi:hypothetical protein